MGGETGSKKAEAPLTPAHRRQRSTSSLDKTSRPSIRTKQKEEEEERRKRCLDQATTARTRSPDQQLTKQPTEHRSEEQVVVSRPSAIPRARLHYGREEYYAKAKRNGVGKRKGGDPHATPRAAPSRMEVDYQRGDDDDDDDDDDDGGGGGDGDGGAGGVAPFFNQARRVPEEVDEADAGAVVAPRSSPVSGLSSSTTAMASRREGWPWCLLRPDSATTPQQQQQGQNLAPDVQQATATAAAFAAAASTGPFGQTQTRTQASNPPMPAFPSQAANPVVSGFVQQQQGPIFTSSGYSPFPSAQTGYPPTATGPDSIAIPDAVNVFRTPRGPPAPLPPWLSQPPVAGPYLGTAFDAVDLSQQQTVNTFIRHRFPRLAASCDEERHQLNPSDLSSSCQGQGSYGAQAYYPQQQQQQQPAYPINYYAQQHQQFVGNAYSQHQFPSNYTQQQQQQQQQYLAGNTYAQTQHQYGYQPFPGTAYGQGNAGNSYTQHPPAARAGNAYTDRSYTQASSTTSYQNRHSASSHAHPSPTLTPAVEAEIATALNAPRRQRRQRNRAGRR
ncbi:hypothetical protein XA68_17472 [Ophiocordyceps unilateralis]|uniref:Uncharacterized protein n=1 Tax=Ophiocordyceps unilateralis TaxID=268505 RepID=A0A2A9P3F7_OPHUN|nr:hypothetical protein XA68_17472 [Ophiocordyceps unilateralis]